MSDNRSVFQRYIDEFWNGDLDVADELYPDDHRYHDPNLPDLPQARGRRGARSHLQGRGPNAGGRVHDWVEGGDKIACHWTYRGTHLAHRATSRSRLVR